VIEAAVVEIDPKTKKKTVKRPGKITLVKPLNIDGKYLKEVETTWSGPPSVEMEGLDTEAEAQVEKRVETFMSINDLPITPAQAKA
jgi:hypothetical protein